MTRVAYTKKKKEEGRRNSATDPNSSNCAVLPAPPSTTSHQCTHLHATPQDSANSHQTMASRSSNSPPDLEWKRDAVEAFGMDAADEQQKEWLKGKFINTNKPAYEQADRLDAILTEAKTDVLHKFRAGKKLSSGDTEFLKSKGIKPDTPAADQDASINALVGQLATPRQATVTFDSIVEEVSADTVKERLTTDQRVLFSSSGADWKWQDGGLKGRITATLDKNREKRLLQLSKKEMWDKQDMTQVILASGPGTGKSKALTELGKHFAELGDGQIRIVLRVTFENGTNFDPAEVDSGKAVMDRVYHHLLFGNRSAKPFHDWVKCSGGSKETFNGMLDAVAKLYKCDSVECILLLDGVHNLGGGYGTDGEPSTLLRGFLKAWLCATVLGSRHHIFPVCAMTSDVAAMKVLHGSTTRHEYFFAPRLQSLPEGFPDEYSEVAEPYFWMTDGHGRVLETILSILQEGKVTTLGGLLTEVHDELTKRYSHVVEKTTTRIDAAMQAAVKREHITEVQGGLGEWSLFTLERVPGQPETTVYAAPTFVWILLNAGRCEDSLLSGYDFTSEQMCKDVCRKFKEFVAWYRVLLSKVHGGAEPVSVAEFHRGVDWVKSPGSLKMRTESLAPRRVYRCAKRETTRALKNKVKTTTLGAPENTKTLGATFLNAELASGADVFTGVEYDNKRNAYETIQCTHTSEAQVLHAKKVKADLEKYADPAGVFLLVSNRPWKDTPENVKRLEEACRQYAAVGLVHEGNFRDYFLPTFASMWLWRNPQQSSPTGMLRASHITTTHPDTSATSDDASNAGDDEERPVGTMGMCVLFLTERSQLPPPHRSSAGEEGENEMTGCLASMPMTPCTAVQPRKSTTRVACSGCFVNDEKDSQRRIRNKTKQTASHDTEPQDAATASFFRKGLSPTPSPLPPSKVPQR